MTTSVRPAQRFSPEQPCPICGGHAQLPRGHARRCFGFRSADGKYVHCTREEYAGRLQQNAETLAYAHRLGLACRCGSEHTGTTVQHPASAARRKPSAIVATFDYSDATSTLLYQVVRFAPKDFRQRRPDPTSSRGWTWNLDGVTPILYRLAELHAADPAAIVWIPEGEKDTDRICSLGLVATCNSGGAGKWRPEFAEELRGRAVLILPDNDAAGRRHADQVAASLFGVAASVRILALPGLAEHGDVSDWLDSSGLDDRTAIETLCALAEAAPEWKPGAAQSQRAHSSDSDDKTQLTVPAIAARIQAAIHFARDDGGRLYCLSEGVYLPDGDATVQRHVKALLTADEDTAGQWSSHFAKETAAFIAVDAPRLPDRPRLDLLNLRNGLLDVTTRELHPHDPRYLTTVQLPIDYNPTATCPAWERFVGQVFPDDGAALAYELVAWLMTPDTSVQKAVLLLGDGANGKSTFINALIAVLGRSNVSNLSLHKLESDRFGAVHLFGRLANVCADLPSAKIESSSMFKAVVGGDPIMGERKFHEAFEFTPFARLLFSANALPQSADASEAFFRRWLVVPFNARFTGQDAIPQAELVALLTAPSELSGLLNRALDALPAVRARGLTESTSMRQAREEFRQTTDPIAVWLDHQTVEQPDAHVSWDALRRAYNDHANRAGYPLPSAIAFNRAVKAARPAVREHQRTLAGKVVRVWSGLGLRAERDGRG